MNPCLRTSPRSWEWLALTALFLALRLGGLALFHPYWNNTCAIEEYYRGTLAHELLRSLSMPYWQYRADDSGGGSLVLGLLAAPFFKIFGSSAFVLKSVPVLISLASLLLWFKILYQEFSRKCAWYFSLFFIFAPSAFQSWSTVALGDHYETIFLSALAVWLFLQRRAFLLGLVCGFGIWFAYIFTLTVIVLMILWFRRHRRLLLTRDFWTFASGFLIGFSPWIFINLKTNFGGLKVHGGYLWWHLHPLRSLYYWKRYYWETSFFLDIFGLFSHPLLGLKAPRRLFPWLYTGLLLIPVILWLLLRLKERPKGRPFFSGPVSDVSLYFGLYALVHSASVAFSNCRGPIIGCSNVF